VIQTTIDIAVDGDEIEIEPGTYSENLTITKNVTLRGLETARTIIDAPNSSPAISISNTSDVTVQNLTFTSASIGIQVTNGTSNIFIINNVFNLGTRATPNGTAIDVTDSSDVKINFNTFFGNTLAIDRSSNLTIENNIFSNNTTDINSGDPEAGITLNCFSSDTTTEGSSAINNATITFADETIQDFHLQAPSECIDMGNVSGISDIIDNSSADSGAYGGDNADVLPYPPQQVTLTLTGTTMTPGILIEWDANLSYLVVDNGMDSGGYRVFYGFNQSGPPYDGTINGTEGNSPIDVMPFATTQTLTDIKKPDPKIELPVVSIAPSSNTLDVTWTADANVTHYTLDYGINSPDDNTETFITDTKFTLTGLTNNETYQVRVTAHFQPKYYIAVTAYDNTTEAHESNLSTEKSINVGDLIPYPSAIETSIPEEIIPFPNLPGEGCFIATAAFGYYSAPQVQILRDFRDEILLNNAPGRLFVSWYYHYGPVAATYLYAYPVLKSVARVLLYPLIYFAKFVLNTSIVSQVLTSLTFIIFFFALLNFRLRNKNDV